MQPTTEVRWFMPGLVPDAVTRWFDALGSPVAAASRTDRYLQPSTVTEPGVKLREGLLQVKARTAMLGTEVFGSGVEGVVETYRKWSLPVAEGAEEPGIGWVDVAKTRQVRLFTPDGFVEQAGWVDAGCNAELGEVRLGDQTWWTVCLEAFGPDAAAQHAVLRQAAQQMFARSDAPTLERMHSAGYVGWLVQARPGAQSVSAAAS